MWGFRERQLCLVAGPCNVPDSNFAGGAAISRAHNAGSNVSISPRSPSSRQGASVRGVAAVAGAISTVYFMRLYANSEADDYVWVRSQGCGQHADAVSASSVLRLNLMGPRVAIRRTHQ